MATASPTAQPSSLPWLPRAGPRGPVPRWLVVGLVAVGVGVAASGTSGLAAPGPLLAGTVAVTVIAATIADPRLGLGALAFAMVFSPEVGGNVRLRIDDVIVAAATLGWLANQAVRPEPLRRNPLLVPMVLLAGAGLAALSLAAVGGNVDPFTGREVPLAIASLHWVKRVEYFLILFLVAQILRTRREVAAFAGLLIAAGAAVALQSVGQIAAHADDPAFRLAAPFDTGEANTLGEYFMFVMALGVGLLLYVRSTGLRLALAGFLALAGYAFLFTYSRGSYVGLVVVIVVAAWLRDARLLLVAAALALVLPGFLPSGVTARVETIPTEVRTLDSSDGGSNALLARIDSYRVAAQRTVERPILGYGPGVVALARIESQYAREAVDGGLLGLALFGWFLWRAGRVGSELRRGAREDLGRGLGLGYLAGVIGLGVAALGAIPFTTIRTMEAFCFASGLAVVLWRVDREQGAATEAGR